ncbi:hypothetical protein U9M48_003253, partial [Paspalum notatum var. saurae]
AEPGRVLRPRRCCRHQPGARAPPSPSCTVASTSWTPRRNRLGTSTPSGTRATPPSAPRARAASSSPTISTATPTPRPPVRRSCRRTLTSTTTSTLPEVTIQTLPCFIIYLLLLLLLFMLAVNLKIGSLFPCSH